MCEKHAHLDRKQLRPLIKALEINMIKSIKNIRNASIWLLLIFLSSLVGSQYLLFKQTKIEYTEEIKKNRIAFIKTTQDIQNLRKVSLLLIESDYEYTDYLNGLYETIRNLSLGLLFYSVLLVFYSTKLYKQFLTKSSSGTTNP